MLRTWTLHGKLQTQALRRKLYSVTRVRKLRTCHLRLHTQAIHAKLTRKLTCKAQHVSFTRKLYTRPLHDKHDKLIKTAWKLCWGSSEAVSSFCPFAQKTLDGFIRKLYAPALHESFTCKHARKLYTPTHTYLIYFQAS